MILETFSMTNEQMEDFATQVKNMVVGFLHDEGVLDDEKAVNYTNNYAFLYRKPSFFRRLFPKKKKKGEEHKLLILVRQCSLQFTKEEACGESQKTSKESATPDSSSETSTETGTQQCDAS